MEVEGITQSDLLKESLKVILKSGLCWNSWKSRMEIVRLIARSRHVVWCRGG